MPTSRVAWKALAHSWHLLNGTVAADGDTVVYVGLDFAMDKPRDSERNSGWTPLNMQEQGWKPVPSACGADWGSCLWAHHCRPGKATVPLSVPIPSLPDDRVGPDSRALLDLRAPMFTCGAVVTIKAKDSCLCHPKNSGPSDVAGWLCLHCLFLSQLLFSFLPLSPVLSKFTGKLGWMH
jgi:hypothetical protein